MLCLISVDHTNSQLATLLFDYDLIEDVHSNFQCEKLVWTFSSAYLDENSRPNKYCTIVECDQGKNCKIN